MYGGSREQRGSEERGARCRGKEDARRIGKVDGEKL